MKQKQVALLLAAVLLAGLCGCRAERDKAFPLPEEGFYELRLSGILREMEGLYALEPHLSVSSLDVMFDRESGALSKVEFYLYGYDEEKRLRHGYLVYTVKKRDHFWIQIHPQRWNSENGARAYQEENDFRRMCAMVDALNLKAEAKEMTYERCGILSEGIRDFGFNTDSLYRLYPDGTAPPYEIPPEEGGTPIEKLSFSLYSMNPDTGMPGGAVKRYVPDEKEGLTWNSAE